MDPWKSFLKRYGVKNNMKLAKGSKGWIFSSLFSGIIFLILSILLSFGNISSVFLLVSVFLFILTLFFVMFFRDPDRKTGKGIVSPADGKIRDIYDVDDPDIGKSVCISIFMNVNDVHVNRMSYDGKIKSLDHIYGLHLPAFKKESEKNERTIILVDSKIGIFKIVQIAGTLARRIVPYIKKEDTVKKGKRIGIIRLGSRVDLYIPKNKIKKVCVKKKDKIKAGVDTIAEINA